MNDDRQFRRAGHFHLLKEDALLHVARRMIVEVVEPDFAPGYNLGIARQSFKLIEIFLLRELGLVRMNANRGVNAFMLLREFDSTVERARARTISIADGEDGRDPGCLRTSKNLGAVSVVSLGVEMGVGVGVHSGCG